MSLDIVVGRSKKIESLLVRAGAEGRGLHEKVTSIESKLEIQEVKRIRFIASLRNKSLHDDSFELTKDILSNFISACDAADLYLSGIVEPSSSGSNSDEGRFEKFSNASTLGKVAGIVASLGVIAFLNR